MSITRSTINGGPAFIAFASQTIVAVDSFTLDLDLATYVIKAAGYGEVDEVDVDLLCRLKFKPRLYDPAAAVSVLCPSTYLQPSIGGRIFGGSDTACEVKCFNGETYTLTAAAVGKMPDLTLGVDADVMGECEIWGTIGTGLDPSSANSYYTIGTWTAADPDENLANLGNMEWTAVWGSVTGFTSFQAQDKWTITHDLKLQPFKVQGRTRDYYIDSSRTMAKCIPLGPTPSNIDAAYVVQGTGAGGGRRRSTNAADLVLTGAVGGGSSNVVTIKKAALKSAGFQFANIPLRAKELGWVSTIAIGSGSPNATLTLA